MWTASFAALALASAIAAVLGAIYVHIHEARRDSRLQTVEEKYSSLQSKLASQDRWTRDEIREQVDNYLQSLDLESSSGGMGDEMFQAMLPMLMQGGFPAGQGNPQESSQVNDGPSGPPILGRGGTNGSDGETVE